jgi:hypothetical protein
MKSLDRSLERSSLKEKIKKRIEVGNFSCELVFLKSTNYNLQISKALHNKNVCPGQI